VGNVETCVELKEEIQTLMEGKGKAIAELKDGEWVREFV
jgi:hypothetical protein